MDNNNQQEIKRFLPLHIKLLGVILFFLIFLTLIFCVTTYFSGRSHLLNELEAKKYLLESLVVDPYQKMNKEEFNNYTQRHLFYDILNSLDVLNVLMLDANDDLIYSDYSPDTYHRIVKEITKQDNKEQLQLKGYTAGFVSKYFGGEHQTYDYQILMEKDGRKNGVLYASIDLKSYHAKMATFIFESVLISIVIFFISIVIFLYSTKVVTKPITILKDSALKVAQGDFDVKVNFISDDELGQLVISFNEMTAKLKKYNDMRLDQIKSLNEELIIKNAELEANYEELEATNEELETTNEELIATNEELEIANRDLFTMAQEIKKSKEELEKNMTTVTSANEELSSINKIKTNFLGMASHELKTPLVMIKGYAELILDGKSESLDASIVEMIAHILQGADTLNSIIRDMLDITKIEAKELKLNIAPVELSLIINTVIIEMEEIAKERGQTLKKGALPDISIPLDVPQIHRVISHLIGNAIKFTPDKGKIEVYANIVKDDILGSMNDVGGPMDAIDIVVADSGIGIDKKEQEKIFEIFYEVGDIDHHKTSKSAYLGKGTGLGLPICKGIVEGHNGRLWVESEGADMVKLSGSKFHVVLPLEQKIFEKEAVARAITPIKKKENFIKKAAMDKQLPQVKPKILLIEDDSDIIELVTLILKDKYIMETTNNGADGIKKAFTFKPDIILLDVYMKGLTGYEVCAILKENEASKDIPIAMFSAGTQKYEIEKGYKVGVDDYITKPFHTADLISRIERLINKRTGTNV